MSYKIIGLVVGALFLGPVVAKATEVTGSFSGSVNSGTDSTGVFGADGGVLDSDGITGTFTYNTDLFSQAVADGTNTATGTGLGALTVTITINGVSYTFTDQTSSSVFLDDGSVSGNDEVTLNTLNQQSGAATVNETFTLDVQDPIDTFITGTGLAQSFTDDGLFLDGTGTFQILDTGPSVDAGGGFTISSISATEVPAPEPASLMVLAVGLGGIAAGRMRGKRRQVNG